MQTIEKLGHHSVGDAVMAYDRPATEAFACVNT